MNRLHTLVAAMTLPLLACAPDVQPPPPSGAEVPPPSGDDAPVAGPNWDPTLRPLGAGRDPQMVVRASGALYVMRAVRGSDGADLMLASSKDAGDSFSRPLRINHVPGEVEAHGENGPQLRTGTRSEFYASWVGEGDIRFARSTNFARSFSDAVSVNDDDEDAHQSFFTMEVAPDGAVHLVWLDFRSQPGKRRTCSLYTARSTDRGASFGGNVKIAGDVCPCCRPALSFADGNPVVVWRHIFPGNERDLAASTSTDGGQSWGATVRVAEDRWVVDGCPHSGPSVAFHDGALHAAWYTGAGDRGSIRHAVSRDGAASFGPTREIQAGVLDANRPHIALLDGGVWSIFQGRDGDAEGGWGRVQTWLTRLDTADINAPIPLPETGGSASYPRLLAGGGGRLYGVWNSTHGETTQAALWRGRTDLLRTP